MKRLLIFFLLVSRVMAQTHTFPATDTNNNFTGTNTMPNLNSVLWVDGVRYATIESAYAALPSTGGTVMVPPNFTETPSGNIALSTNFTNVVFTGPATITLGSHQIVLPASFQNIGIESLIPMGASESSPSNGVLITCNGCGQAIVAGTSSAFSRGFRLRNIGFSLSANSDQALRLNQVVGFVIDSPVVMGNGGGSSTEVGINCNGTGSQYTGNGVILNAQFSSVNVGIQGNGSGTNGCNATQIIGGTMNSPAGSGSIGIDIENGEGNTIYGFDAEGLSVGYQLGAGAVANDFRVRSESNTNDLGCNASSSENVFHLVNGGSSVNTTGSCGNNSFDVDARSIQITASNMFLRAGAVFLGSAAALTNLWESTTAPTISSGFNTGSIASTPNGTAEFFVTVGTGAAGSTGTITLPSAATGWHCTAENQNRADYITQTANSATSVTLTNWGTTFAATNFTNSDTLLVRCGAH